MSEKFTITQVSEILQVEPSTIRFWEKEFAEYLKVNCKGKRKRYTEEHLEMFAQIKELLYTEQYTIKGAKRRLELDKALNSALGIEQNFKNTVVFMLSSIMEELQKAREESKKLARQVELLRHEKKNIQEKLLEEQNKSLLEFLKDKISTRKLNEVGN
ncbi:MAG: MerR family transcriptional regulator [Clostridia bacterium]|nr:MerR family transcriptional regulator [Clostridia bacterium]